MTDFAYAPRDAHVELTSTDGGRFAVPSARARRRMPFRHVPASSTPVELRGAGQCSRQVNNLATPAVFEADRLIVCEVLTPAGNWSSYPPHKHDEDRGDAEAVLEEIYYFEVADGPAGPGVAYQRVYGTADRPVDVLAEVRSGDVVLVPHGWHGPSMAVPGYDLYYLNVMAGPGEHRAWLICDDPAHAWVRGTWEGQPVDPRLPFYESVWEGVVSTVRLTVGQAVVRFLSAQRSERDGVEHRLVEGVFGIFGHGNVAGVGQALLESELNEPGTLPYYQARNEQGMVHAAAGFARMRNRLSTLACTASVGPGSTNMVTGAALATVNRLPGAAAARRRLRDPRGLSCAAGARRPAHLRRVGQRCVPPGVEVLRPHQPARAAARRQCSQRCVSSSIRQRPVPSPSPSRKTCRQRRTTGRSSCSHHRVWHVARPVPEPAALDRAVEVIRGAQRPLLVAGGGLIYSEATAALAALVEATGIPVAETQAGKGSLAWNHPLAVGAIGATGTAAANELAREADVVIGVGTRWSDFTTASRSAFAAPGVRFVNVNVAAFDAAKHSGVAVVADARVALEQLVTALAGLVGRPGLPSAQPRTGRRLGPDRRARLHAGARPAARPVGSHRGCQRCQRAPRCRGVRGRLDAGRPPQALANP